MSSSGVRLPEIIKLVFLIETVNFSDKKLPFHNLTGDSKKRTRNYLSKSSDKISIFSCEKGL